MGEYFEIEGKKYISSKRASEITGYAKDYIGQLSRGGKIAAKQIGRNWFIDEASLLLHKFGEQIAPQAQVVPEQRVAEMGLTEAAAASPALSGAVHRAAFRDAATCAPTHRFTKNTLPKAYLLSAVNVRYYPGYVAFFQDERPLFPSPIRPTAVAAEPAVAAIAEHASEMASEAKARGVVATPEFASDPSFAMSSPSEEGREPKRDSYLPSFGFLQASAALSIMLCALGFGFATLFTERVTEIRSVAASGSFSVESKYLMTIFQ